MKKTKLDKLQPWLLVVISAVAFSVLISRVASYSSDAPIEIINDVAEFSEDFQQATTEEINNFILLYWYDNMFIVPFGLFMAGLLSIVPLPRYVKLALYCTSIPAHPVCDWIENTAAVMSYISYTQSEDRIVDERWIRQYFIWSKVKWAMLGINAVAIIVGFSFYMRHRFCKKSE